MTSKWFDWELHHTFAMQIVQFKVTAFLCTVKLGIKELLNKEQTGFKELFTDYQPFYTINLLLNKELWQSRKCQNLALVNTRLWKLAKEGDFRNVLNYFWDFTLKRNQNQFQPNVTILDESTLYKISNFAQKLCSLIMFKCRKFMIGQSFSLCCVI